MTTSNSRPTTGLLLVAFAVLGVALAIVFLVRKPQAPVIPQRPMRLVNEPRRSSEEILRLIELKNRAVGELENENFRASIDLLEELAKELPGEPLVATNLTIAYLLLLRASDISEEQGSRVYQETVEKAVCAADRLLQMADDTATSHLLASKIARLVPDEKRSIEQMNIAAELAPEDPAVWYELYQAGRYSDDEEIKARSLFGLRRTYELWPDNLFVVREWLLQQAKNTDPTIAETLANARNLVQPLVEETKQPHGFDLLDAIDKTIATVRDRSKDERTRWNTVTRDVRLIANLLGIQKATRIDRRRIDRQDLRDLRQLEFAMRDFSKAFYATTPSIRKELGPPLNVKLIPLPDEQQLPPLPGARDVKLADVDLDGRLDVVVVRDRTVEAYGRGKEGYAWRLLAAYESPTELRGVVVADLDRDFTSHMATHALGAFRNTDPDLIVYGSGGVSILENEIDATGRGRRSLRVVPQDADFERLSNVFTVAVVDLDHEGDSDLVVSADDGISLWMNCEQFSFKDISDRSDLPPMGLNATAIVPVDWNGDMDIDVVLTGPSSDVAGYIENIRHGRFRWQPFSAEDDNVGGVASLCLADVDGNAHWDLIACGEDGMTLTQTTTSSLGSVQFLKSSNISNGPVQGMATWDFDNDGFLDIVAWGDRGLGIYRGEPNGLLRQTLDLADPQPARVQTCAVGDVDCDGDWDLLVAEPERLVFYANEGGNQNHWIDVILRADANPEQFPDLRVNMHGIGSLVEVRVGPICQRQIVTSSTVHYGLGRYPQADVVRVRWTNGLSCNEIGFESNQVLLKQQQLKGM